MVEVILINNIQVEVEKKKLSKVEEKVLDFFIKIYPKVKCDSRVILFDEQVIVSGVNPLYRIKCGDKAVIEMLDCSKFCPLECNPRAQLGCRTEILELVKFLRNNNIETKVVFL